jgi:hypothetical protein
MTNIRLSSPVPNGRSVAQVEETEWVASQPVRRSENRSPILAERPANGRLPSMRHQSPGSSFRDFRSPIADSLRRIFEKLPLFGDGGRRPGSICTVWWPNRLDPRFGSYCSASLLKIASSPGDLWKKGAKFLDRPFIERRVDIEIDDAQAGSIRIRPTEGDATVDLKPYEELGCEGLHLLSGLVRDAIRRAADNDGISPFIKESFEPILFAAATRLDPEGIYAPDDAPLKATQAQTDDKRLSISDKWVLFARPRSQHIVLQDIERLRQAAEQAPEQVTGVAARLVSEPLTERTGNESIGTTKDPVPEFRAKNATALKYPLLKYSFPSPSMTIKSK